MLITEAEILKNLIQEIHAAVAPKLSRANPLDLGTDWAKNLQFLVKKNLLL